MTTEEHKELKNKYNTLKKAFNSLLNDYISFVDAERGKDRELNARMKKRWNDTAGLNPLTDKQ